jgi:hypothetical protein
VRFNHEGNVSLWIGHFASREDLLEYLEWKYDEDGESSCAFAAHSGLGRFDHDLQEADFLGGQPSQFGDALEGFSYVESFEEAAGHALSEQHGEWNSLLLLYDCAFDPERAHPSKASRLRYVGTFGYSKGTDPGETEFGVRRAE